jgi:hypothetical protein
MKPYQIARRLDCRPGFRLVDFCEVALPIYALSVRAVTLTRKPVPAIDEFVLRAMRSGFDGQADIASFLGLELSVVRGALVSLAEDESIALGALEDSRSQHLLMTAKGKNVLEKSEVVVPEERSFVLHFDGLLRNIHLFRIPDLWHPREIRDLGIVEIPSSPARKPEVNDLKLPELGQVIRSAAGAEGRRELLAIRGIEKATRLFRRAVALLFESRHDKDLQLGFAIEGTLSNEHENAFALGPGLRKLGIPQSVSWSPSAVLGRLDSTLSLPSDVDAIRSLEEEVSKAELAVQQAQHQLKRAGKNEAKSGLSAQSALAEAELLERQHQLDSHPIRELESYDHPVFLDKAFEQCKKRLVIITGKIVSSVVSREFIEKLTTLAKMSVEIHIGWYSESGPGESLRSKRNRAAELKLRDLSTEYKTVHVEKLGMSQENLLLVDQEFAILTNFDFLSFEGDPYRRMMSRKGVLLRLPPLIDKLYEQIILKF